MLTPAKRDIAAAEMIARLREQQTLDALTALVTHLEVMRPERKFVMVFTEGWPLYRSDHALRASSMAACRRRIRSASIREPAACGTPGRADPKTGQSQSHGGLRSPARRCWRTSITRSSSASCCSAPIAPTSASIRSMRAAWWCSTRRSSGACRRRSTRRGCATATTTCGRWRAQTDGEVVLNTNDVSAAMQKVFADVGSYYLLSYYSTNPKLDGRFRRIRVEVKRPDVDVRSRPGYLAPTEAEARAAGAAIDARRRAKPRRRQP